MSYDLFFRSERHVTQQDLRAYFAQQPSFKLNAQRAHYEHEVTGVYFGFDFTNDAPGRVPVAFNLNYFRPHVFGLEAEPVVTAFVAAFDLGVDDPQVDGMGQGPYSPAGFLRGWNAGNRSGYLAIMSMPEAPTPLTMPSARVRGIWQWNRGKDLNTEHMLDFVGEVPPCFLPTVMFVRTGEHEVKSVVIWDTKMAVAIPSEVDLIVTTGDDGKLIAAPTSDVLGLLRVHTTWAADFELAKGMPIGLTTRLFDEVSPEVTAQVRAAMRRFEPRGRVSPDAVLDAELVAEAKR